MIKQTAIGLASRELANPYNENGFLPLITAPMYSVVDETNYQIFLDNKIQVCLPRNKGSKDSGNYFTAVSLQEFKDEFIGDSTPIRYWPLKRCIDTANGNMPELHNAIRKAKEIHGDNLIIMAGNVASVEAFIELAKTGVDYIRVGIGGGCLAADTRILMANGTYKNIIDVQIGDYVVNRDGNPVKVINTFYSGRKKVSKIKHNAFYNSLTVTNDHLVRVSDLSSYKKSSVSSKGYKAFFKEDTWKPISESINDNLLSPVKINYKLPIDFNINLNQFDSEKSKNVVGNIKPSYELGYIFGTFLGDGNINIREDFYAKRNSINKTGSVHWAFGKNEDSIVLTLIEYIENVFREESGYRKEENKIRVTLYRKWAAQLFSEFYTENGTKYLPNKWYCLNDDYLRGLYNGLIDSDGHKELTIDCFENTSPYLIELIYFIKSNLQGYFPNTEQRKKTCGKLENCNENNLKQSYSLRTLSNYLARQTEKFNLLKVTSFENNFDEVDTYDIEVDCPTHSFVANNCIVHNSGCNTTSNTGVGQENLEELIQSCNRIIKNYKLLSRSKQSPNLLTTLQEVDNTSKVKIIADGISSYIKLCQEKYGFNDNGYAAINKLLFAGADLVMVGKLFAQCIESAGEKGILDSTLEVNQIRDLEEFNEDTGANDVGDPYKSYSQVFYNTTPNSKNQVMVKYSGMSTQEEQKKYKSEHYWKWWWGNSKTGSIIDETVFYNFEELKTYSSKHSFENSSKYENYYSNYTKHRLIKPSEGSVSWIPVRFLLKDWIKGNSEQDSYPFLMGFENSLRSAMSYAGSKTLEEFKNGK